MKHTAVCRFPVLLVLTMCAFSAEASAPRDLDTYSGRVLRTFGTPGMAVSIVENGEPVLAKGHGVLEIGSSRRVDEHSVFPIGSNSKAFTAAVLAILVDQGKLDWDDRVIDHLPAFRAWDPYVTAEMTVRDLLVHRSGLGPGAGDLMLAPETTFSRDEIVERVRHLKPAEGFRSGFSYSNILYVVAGQVAAAAGESSWDDLVRTEIFEPLDMRDSRTVFSQDRSANRALGHARTTGALRGLGPQRLLAHTPNLDNVAAAGGIGVSAQDMARWIAANLNQGAINKSSRRLFSAKQSRELLSPQTLIPIRASPPALALAQPKFRAYALGWTIQDYRGHRIAIHAGGVLGGVSIVVLIPERKIGFAVLINAEEDAAIRSMAFYLLDHYLGAAPHDWIAANDEVRRAALAQAQAVLQGNVAARATNAPASLAATAYAGVYRDPWYGDVIVRERDSGLEIEFSRSPGMKGALEHWHFDTFRTQFRDPLIEDAFITFGLDADGKIDGATLRAASPIADFSFDYHDLRLKPVRQAEDR